MTTFRLAMFPLGMPCVPGESLPLQIFEKRYLSLLQSVLARSEPTFGVVMIERGHEVGGGDVRSSIGTLVSVERVVSIDETHVGVLCRCLERIRIVSWLKDDPHPWAIAELWPCEDAVVDPSQFALPTLTSLIDRTRRLVGPTEIQLLSRVEFIDSPAIRQIYVMARVLGVGPSDIQDLLESEDGLTLWRKFVEILEHVEEVKQFLHQEP